MKDHSCCHYDNKKSQGRKKETNCLLGHCSNPWKKYWRSGQTLVVEVEKVSGCILKAEFWIHFEDRAAESADNLDVE